MDSGRTQFTEDVVDVLVVARRQDPKSKRAHKTVLAPQAQFIDGHPRGATENKFPTVQTAQKTFSDHAETSANHPEDPEDC